MSPTVEQSPGGAYTNIHYKMTIFYLCIGFVEVKNTDTHLYIRQTNNLFVYISEVVGLIKVSY